LEAGIGKKGTTDLFQDMLTVAKFNPELVEKGLLKAFESDEWKTLKFQNIRSTKNEKTYVEVAEQLFLEGKGEEIVKKSFETYLTLFEGNSENVFFLQQLLDTAINNNLFNNNFFETLHNSVSNNWRDSKFNLDFPLQLLYKAPNPTFVSTNPANELVIRYQVERDPVKSNQIKEDLKKDLKKNSDFKYLDLVIRDYLFDKSNTIDEGIIELIDHLIDNNFGHKTLIKILENDLHLKIDLDNESSTMMINIINRHPQFIDDFFFDIQNLGIPERERLQKLISKALSEKKINEETITNAFSKAIENKKSNEKVLKSVQIIAQNLSPGERKNALLNHIENKFEMLKDD
jgi:hypothetical protein